MKVGTKVHHIPYEGAIPQNGIVKSLHVLKPDEAVFVVFRCNNDWDHYTDYTGQQVDVADLKEDWVN